MLWDQSARGDITACVSDVKGQEWIRQSILNYEALCSLGSQAFKPPLCVTFSGGSSRTTAVGSGSDLAAALSLPQLGIFRKWPGQWRSRMEMP